MFFWIEYVCYLLVPYHNTKQLSIRLTSFRYFALSYTVLFLFYSENSNCFWLQPTDCKSTVVPARKSICRACNPWCPAVIKLRGIICCRNFKVCSGLKKSKWILWILITFHCWRTLLNFVHYVNSFISTCIIASYFTLTYYIYLSSVKIGCAGWNWTTYLLVMSQVSYRFSSALHTFIKAAPGEMTTSPICVNWLSGYLGSRIFSLELYNTTALNWEIVSTKTGNFGALFWTRTSPPI